MRMPQSILAVVSTASAGLALAAPEAQKPPLNVPAITMFFLFVALTLGITYWAAKRTKTARLGWPPAGGLDSTGPGGLDGDSGERSITFGRLGHQESTLAGARGRERAIELLRSSAKRVLCREGRRSLRARAT